MSRNSQPIVVLVEPQLAANIGMCARAMLNCGLEKLRLVKPREGWPSEAARAAASDADIVISGAKVFSSLKEAIADCDRVVATTARRRSLATPIVSSKKGVEEIGQAAASGQRVAVLFGPEASGLDNDCISYADTLMRFATNPEFSSLNLAQAVLLFGWEWRSQAVDIFPVDGQKPSSVEDLDNLVNRAVDLLDKRGFFLTEEMRPGAVRKLRSLFSRSRPTSEEVGFLNGVITALTRAEEPPERQ